MLCGFLRHLYDINNIALKGSTDAGLWVYIYDIQLHLQNYMRANLNWTEGRIRPAGRSLDTPVLNHLGGSRNSIGYSELLTL